MVSKKREVLSLPVSARIEEDTYLLIKTRMIHLSGEVNEEMASWLLHSLEILNQENHDPVTLYINSQGGDYYEMTMMLDCIHRSPAPVNIVATGQVCSAAAFFVAMGPKKRRFATPNVMFMFHKAWTDPGMGEAEQQKSRADFDIKSQERLIAKLSRILKPTKKTLEKYFRNEWYLDAEEAIKQRVVDGIWPCSSRK